MKKELTHCEDPMARTPFIKAPGRVSLYMPDHCPVVGCGETLLLGAVIGRSRIPGLGDMCSPMSGKVAAVARDQVVIEAGEGDETILPVDIAGLAGDELSQALLGLGADLRGLADAETVVINAVDAEEGLHVGAHLLSHYMKTLEAGLGLVHMAAPHARRAVLAVGKDHPSRLSACETMAADRRYPHGLDPLVAKEATGSENLERTAVVSAMRLYEFGRIKETGLPLSQTFVSLGNRVIRLIIGTPVGEVLSREGVEIMDGDRVVLGSPLRGLAAANPAQGVGKDGLGIFVFRKDAFPPVADAPCAGCGECVIHCPARIDPGMVANYAEFGLFAKARKHFVETCFECGLCGYYCPSRRPLLQYIRLAKRELVERDRAATAQKEGS